jgi:hypothetical protein
MKQPNKFLLALLLLTGGLQLGTLTGCVGYVDGGGPGYYGGGPWIGGDVVVVGGGRGWYDHGGYVHPGGRGWHR